MKGATSLNSTNEDKTPRCPGTSYRATVFVDEASQEVNAFDAAAGRQRRCDAARRRYGHREVDAEVRPARVVVLDVPVEYLVQVPLVPDQRPI